MYKPGLLLAALALLGGVGCSHTPKEKSAPCKRPTNALAYAPAAGAVGCGPTRAVNGDPAAALTAIEALTSE